MRMCLKYSVRIYVAIIIFAVLSIVANKLSDHHLHGMVEEYENREKSPAGFWVVDVPTPI